jgi:hypothetical protein
MGEEMREEVRLWTDFLPEEGRKEGSKERNFRDREREEKIRESPPSIAVVMARAIREPNKNPMSKICSGQTPPRISQKRAGRPSGMRDLYFMFL